MTVITQHVRLIFYVTDVVGAAQTLQTTGPTADLLASYVCAEESGGGESSGYASVTPGAAVDIYDDGVDTVELAVAADGTVTLERTAGADTFNVKIQLEWI